jgi:N-acetylneuraminate lyase
MFTPLHGLNTALFTPFDADGAVCLPALETLLERQIARGVTGFFVCGSTGEGLSLSPQERMAVAETAVHTVAGRAAVMVHVGSTSTGLSVELARHAASVGADAVSSIAPIYYPLSFEAVLTHYKAIGGATDLPFFIYHIPGLTGAQISADSAARLMEIPHLAGMKFTDPALYMMRWLFELTGECLTMLSGPDELHLPALTLGAHGAIGTNYNLMPGAFLRLREAFAAGDIATASDLQIRCNRAIYPMVKAGGLGAFKVAGQLIGLNVGEPRPPVLGPPPEARPQFFTDLEAAGFLELADM